MYRIISVQWIAFQHRARAFNNGGRDFNQLIFGDAAHIEVVCQANLIDLVKPGLAATAIEGAVDFNDANARGHHHVADGWFAARAHLHWVAGTCWRR